MTTDIALEYGVSEFIVNANPLENPRFSLQDVETWKKYFGGVDSDAGVEITPDSVMGYPPMFRAITLIAAKCAGTPKQAIERKTRETIDDHPAVQLVGKFQRTSPLCNSLQWAKAMTVQAQIYGGAWSVIVRDGASRPVEMHMLDPASTCRAIVNGQLYWSTFINGEPAAFHDRDVLHIPSTTPDGMQGWRMIDLMRQALGLPIAAQRYSAKYFSNGANLSGVLMVPGHFDEEKIRNTMDAWGKMTTGLTKAHKIALTQDGVKWQPTAADPEKSQLNETRDHEVRATVTNITGVPPHLLGDPTRTSHNSLESEGTSLLQNCLRIWFDVWEAEMNDKLRHPEEAKGNRVFLEFNVRDLLRMEFDKRVAGYRTMTEIGAMTVNDILAAENMPQIGAEGDVRYRPANWVRADGQEDDMANKTPEQQPDTPDKAEDVLKSLVQSSVTKALKIEADRIVKAAETEENFVAAVDQFYTDWLDKVEIVGGDQEPYISHVVESKRQLLDVAGSVTETNLASSVATCVATWEGRAEVLTQTLIEGITNG